MLAPEVSVVLPVHQGVAPDHFRRAVDSLCEQTMPATEVVVVEDGRLPPALSQVVAIARSRLPVRHVTLRHNQGAGVANQAGLEAATGVWIAKADADDINLPHRFERQFQAVTEHAVDICGSAMLEFVEHEDRVVSLREAPLTHDAIARRMRTNNPMNHPTAFYRRTAAMDAGGYPDWRFMQDYGLVARMHAAGAKMVNLKEPLVLFRAGDGMTRRRRGVEIRKLELALQRELRDLGVVGSSQMWANVVWRSMYRVLPPRTLRTVSRRVLARPLTGPRGPIEPPRDR